MKTSDKEEAGGLSGTAVGLSKGRLLEEIAERARRPVRSVYVSGRRVSFVRWKMQQAAQVYTKELSRLDNTVLLMLADVDARLAELLFAGDPYGGRFPVCFMGRKHDRDWFIKRLAEAGIVATAEPINSGIAKRVRRIVSNNAAGNYPPYAEWSQRVAYLPLYEVDHNKVVAAVAELVYEELS